MFERAPCAIALILALAACNPVDQKSAAPAAAPAAGTARPMREKIPCSQHYAEVREAILGTLRGADSLPLIQVATRVSSMVLDDTASRFNANCSFDSRNFQKLRSPIATPVVPLQGQCAALVEKIDARCLKPLVERGKSLDKNCHVVLVGIADNEQQGMMRRMHNEGFCTSMMDDL
ncbi:MAG: hypothetical protein WAS23_12275 [Dokdonella sp.]